MQSNRKRRAYVHRVGKNVGEAYYGDGSVLFFADPGGAISNRPHMEDTAEATYARAKNLDERELDDRAKRGPYKWKGRQTG